MGKLIGKVTDIITGGSGPALAPLQNYKPTSFSTSGYSGAMKDGTFTLTSSPEVQNQLASLTAGLKGRADEFRGLIPLSKSGFGALTEAGVKNIRAERRKAIGNLRENMARRRISGSSFAEDAAARAEAEFAKGEEEFRATTALQEIDTASRLIDMATQSEIAGVSQILQQMNFEGELAANFSGQLNQIMSQSAVAQSQIIAEYAAARTNIVGSILGGAATGAGIAFAMSDIRMKENIEPIGMYKHIPIFSFTYKGQDKLRFGTMAQLLEKIMPSAVHEVDGYKHVDYAEVYNAIR